ncbi:MAG: hypothetical protein JNK61_10020 [Bacteroidia bacterium]|nr:hypothetical protein [Bacteroidia bacterium]
MTALAKAKLGAGLQDDTFNVPLLKSKKLFEIPGPNTHCFGVCYACVMPAKSKAIKINDFMALRFSF